MQPWETDNRRLPPEPRLRNHVTKKAKQFVFGIGIAGLIYFHIVRSAIRDLKTSQNNKSEI